jgi:hypothetical protein
VQFMKLLISPLQFSPPVVISFHSDANILLSTLFPNTLYLCSSLRVTDQFSCLYKTRRKYNFVYLIFMFADRKIYFPASPLQPWRWRKYVSPKRWHLPTSVHGAKTQKKNIIILTTVKTSNITGRCKILSWMIAGTPQFNMHCQYYHHHHHLYIVEAYAACSVHLHIALRRERTSPLLLYDRLRCIL